MSDLTVDQMHVVRVARERVFAALTDPVDLAKWWGPDGFTIPELEIDLRVGGVYRIKMQPPEGAAFQLTGQFREVEPPARVAYTFVWDPPAPDDRETLVTLELRDEGDLTKVELRQGSFATEERRALHDEGWRQSFVKLERLLSAES